MSVDNPVRSRANSKDPPPPIPPLANASNPSASTAVSSTSAFSNSLQLLRHLPKTIPFDRNDYFGWALQMVTLLEAIGIYYVVDPEQPVANAQVNAEYDQHCKFAYLLLSTALTDAESRLVLLNVQKNDARTLWQRLRQRYQDLPPAALASLLAQLLQAKQERNETVQQFADRISQQAQRLRNNGENVGEREMRMILLQGLVDPIASVVRSYFNSNAKATVADLIIIANGEEAHLNTHRSTAHSSSSRSNSSAALSVNAASTRNTNGGAPECYNCHEVGHVKAQCPQKKQQRSFGNNQSTERTATAEEVAAGRCPLRNYRGHMRAECNILGTKKGATAAAAAATTASKGSIVSLGVAVVDKVRSTQAAAATTTAFSSSVRSLVGTVIDSGAGATVVPTSIQLLNATPADDVTITVANGAVLTRPMRGTAVLPAGKHTLHIRNALQHAQVDRPLLSVSSLLNDAAEVNEVKFIRDSAAAFTPAGDILLTATRVNGVYIVDTEEGQYRKSVLYFTTAANRTTSTGTDTAATAGQSSSQQEATNSLSAFSATSHSELQLLHQRLCHRSLSGIQQLAQSHAVSGVEAVTASAVRELQGQRCDGCAKAKAHRAPFHTHLSPMLEPKTPLGLVVADLAGPLPIPSLTGGRYFLLILDVYTQYVSVSILKHKSEAAREVKAWCRAAAVRHSHPVIHFHSDGGGEFVTQHLRAWFRKKGTQFTDTPAYTPQHNGKVERLNRTILEWANACLIHAGAAKRFWAHAVATAVFIRNHTQVVSREGAIQPQAPTSNAGGDSHAEDAEATAATTTVAAAADAAAASSSSAANRTSQAAWLHESSPLSLSHLRVWGCDADVTLTVAPGQKLPKLTEKSRLCMFLGYDMSKNNAWCFYDPVEQRVRTSRDATFYERQFTIAHTLKQHEQSAEDGNESEDDEQWLTRTALDGEIRLAQKLSLEESAAAGVPSPSSLPRINSSRDGGGDHTRDFASNTSADEQESAPDSESNSSDNSQSSESNEASATESVNEGSAAAAPIPLRRSTRIRQPTHFYGKVNGNLAQARGAYINSLLLGCNIEKVIDEALEQQSSTSLTATNAPATSSPVSTSTHAHHIAIMDLDVSLNSASSAVSSSSPSTIAPAPRIVLPRTFEEAWRIPEWREAIKKEYEAHAKNSTWKIVPLPKGRKAIGWKLVFRIKLHADGSIERYKARLTGKGRFGVELHHIDVETAFLNAKVEEEIYMQVPTGIEAPPGSACRLVKALYGIKQAPHAWHAEIAHTLTVVLHYVASVEDCCLFIKKTRTGGRILFPLFVDDAFPACTKEDEPELLEDIRKLQSIYSVKHTSQVELVLGMRLRRDRAARTLYLDQQLYIEQLLQDTGMEHCNIAATPTLGTSPADHDNANAVDASSSESAVVSVSSYAAVVGSLQYAAIATRPDIAYAVNIAARGLKTPTASYRIAVQHILRYLRGTSELGLTFGGPIDKRTLMMYTDANWAGDSNSDGRSTSGYLARIGSAAVCWRSKKQTIVAQSSMESEYIAAAECCREILWLRRLLCDMLMIDVSAASSSSPTPIACDSLSAITFITHRRINARNKHINVRQCLLQENIHGGMIRMVKVSTQQQLADILTKPLDKKIFKRLVEAVMGKTMEVHIQD